MNYTENVTELLAHARTVDSLPSSIQEAEVPCQAMGSQRNSLGPRNLPDTSKL